MRGDNIKTLIISRVQDIERRQGIQARVPTTLDWEFLDATDGHNPQALESRYAHLIPTSFWGKETIKPGAFGCFVSHYRAWCICAESGQDTLILEDDVTFAENMPEIKRVCKVRKFDVTFLNRGTVGWYQLHEGYRRAQCVRVRVLRKRIAQRYGWQMTRRNRNYGEDVRDLGEVVASIVRSGMIPDNYDTPGACCYLLTANGAKKLIEIADHVGVTVGVDWFILGCALADRELQGNWTFPEEAGRNIATNTAVSVGVSTCWAADVVDQTGGNSVIDHHQFVRIEDYAGPTRKGVGD